MEIILASGSQRRKELLSLVVPKFQIMISGIDEKLEENISTEEQVVRLSYMKAKDIYDKTEGDRIIIGSDTMVVKNGILYGKPKDEDNAKQMIKELLQGDRVHSIMTGLCVLVEIDGKYEEYKTFDEVKVFLKNISDKEIDKWIKTGKAMDKAAAYGIQNEFAVFVEKIEGNYASVVGLPIHKLYDIIKKYIN